jgi:hypothetical protein
VHVVVNPSRDRCVDCDTVVICDKMYAQFLLENKRIESSGALTTLATLIAFITQQSLLQHGPRVEPLASNRNLFIELQSGSSQTHNLTGSLHSYFAAFNDTKL